MANETKEILKLLIENQDRKFSIRKLSLIRKINYKSAYSAVIKLEKLGIIKPERLGNLTLCYFTRKFNPLVFEVEYEKREKLIHNGNFKVIYSRLNQINHSFIALLFGSYVTRKSNKFSDIDILFVTENEKEIKQVISLIPLKIHPTFVNCEEFVKMVRSKEFSVVSDAIKKNIILIGIEDYYRILENAG